MPTHQEDLLQCLQSSLRNALATFGPTSSQYLNIKYMTDELATKIALDKLSISPNGAQQDQDQKMEVA
ncbi:hypothetical protein CC86DRAFT_365169 [Ophiobolus disseminans]|uniref:Uncharacterized protein n=1 Tax=Ophiobolus disseminans TaxID=1469910 RepID=A0A6A7AJ15_9PLEO|nr:hypothetical protein CC86DRAFT_365169 [Ophiobolus disseminans]